MFWIVFAVALVFLAALGVMLRIVYGMGWSAGSLKERERWQPRVNAAAEQVKRLRAELDRRKGPWEIPPPSRRRLASVTALTPPQPSPRPAAVADTSTLTAACKTTGGMRALTDDICAQIGAGTWPPQLPGIAGPDGMT